MKMNLKFRLIFRKTMKISYFEKQHKAIINENPYIYSEVLMISK